MEHKSAVAIFLHGKAFMGRLFTLSYRAQPRTLFLPLLGAAQRAKQTARRIEKQNSSQNQKLDGNVQGLAILSQGVSRQLNGENQALQTLARVIPPGLK